MKPHLFACVGLAHKTRKKLIWEWFCNPSNYVSIINSKKLFSSLHFVWYKIVSSIEMNFSQWFFYLSDLSCISRSFFNSKYFFFHSFVSKMKKNRARNAVWEISITCWMFGAIKSGNIAINFDKFFFSCFILDMEPIQFYHEIEYFWVLLWLAFIEI